MPVVIGVSPSSSDPVRCARVNALPKRIDTAPAEHEDPRFLVTYRLRHDTASQVNSGVLCRVPHDEVPGGTGRGMDPDAVGEDFLELGLRFVSVRGRTRGMQAD